MPLLDGGFGDEFIGESGAKIVRNLGFEGRLVAFEGEQVIGLVFDDLVGDLDLAAHGVDGHERSFELIGFGQVVEEFRDGRDFVGLLGHAELSQDQSSVGRVGTQRVEGLEPRALVVRATSCRRRRSDRAGRARAP